ncbi:GNAT family N-acetyltransferase [Endozoicomonas lisbonensis]|uniref:GNAT superfamily N-acetyltransferase n=1 Tax=Endozoicomonas lisbonensis TaxID=3120522 RepID=A0ABV2SE22_9GAMM
MSEVQIRKANIDDASLILSFVKELAIYEKAENEVIATVEDIEKNLFDESTTTEAVICLYGGKPVGFAVYFLNFSTWLGKNGLYLEDLYVSPEFRGCGAGKKMLKHLAQLAVEYNCGRFEWSVLDWNEPAIKFYESIGAKSQSEWVGYRLQGQALESFAKS